MSEKKLSHKQKMNYNYNQSIKKNQYNEYTKLQFNIVKVENEMASQPNKRLRGL